MLTTGTEGQQLPGGAGRNRRRGLRAGRGARRRPRAIALAAAAGARDFPRANGPAPEADSGTNLRGCSSIGFGPRPAERHHAFQVLQPGTELGVFALEGEDLFGPGVHVHHHLVLHLQFTRKKGR